MESAVMTTAIHIEIDALCVLILCVIAIQSYRNVSQQLDRVLFRNMVLGIIATLTLDIAWLVIEGRTFPGAILLNRVVNALFLSMGVVLGCLWYLYVLAKLGYNISRRMSLLMMLPGILAAALNLVSLYTEWTFYVTPENVYYRGPYFWLQTVGSLGMLLISMIHILIRLFDRSAVLSRKDALKLLWFYIIPIVGTFLTLPYTGMPGVWTCAAISMVLIYMDNQDEEILRDSLTGLNNRKTLDSTFADYSRQAAPGHELYLYMIDLNDFKRINDTFGHTTGDQALVATAKVLTQSITDIRGIIARFGGDEFLIMGFFPGDDDAMAFKRTLRNNFEAYNSLQQLSFPLSVSIGFTRYAPGQSFNAFIDAADSRLYAEKAVSKRGRSKDGKMMR